MTSEDIKQHFITHSRDNSLFMRTRLPLPSSAAGWDIALSTQSDSHGQPMTYIYISKAGHKVASMRTETKCNTK